jgi:ubiquinone/menaquinone biosynthesis C-methylase UbiE
LSSSRHLDEIALAGREHLDATYVAGYDRKAGFDPSSDIELLRAHGLGADSTLVDFGAGTGELALAAAAHCRQVLAIDVSPAMLEAMQAKFAAHRVENIKCIEAGFLSYEHDGEPVDVVYTRNALHHLPDFWKAMALQRLASMLRPGGLLRLRDLVFSFDLQDAPAAIERWLESGASSPEAGWTRAELEEHLEEEHSTFNWLLEPMLEHAGFTIVEREYSADVWAAYLCERR